MRTHTQAGRGRQALRSRKSKMSTWSLISQCKSVRAPEGTQPDDTYMPLTGSRIGWSVEELGQRATAEDSIYGLQVRDDDSHAYTGVLPLNLYN